MAEAGLRPSRGQAGAGSGSSAARGTGLFRAMPNPVYPQITTVSTPKWFWNAYAAYAVVAAPRVADVQAAASTVDSRHEGKRWT